MPLLVIGPTAPADRPRELSPNRMELFKVDRPVEDLVPFPRKLAVRAEIIQAGPLREEDMRVNQGVLGVIDGVEDIRFNDFGRPVPLARERPRFVIAGPVDMINLDLQIPDERIEIRRLHDDLDAEFLHLGDPRPAGLQSAGENLEARPVEVLAEDLDGLLGAPDPQLITSLQDPNCFPQGAPRTSS